MGVIIFPDGQRIRWPVYYFLDARGLNEIARWLKKERVPQGQIADVQAKIDAFERGGPEASPGLMHGPLAKDIYKMKFVGNKGYVQLRPMACYGPFGDTEITVLVGMIEKDFKHNPRDAVQRGQENLKTLKADESRRRRERLTAAVASN